MVVAAMDREEKLRLAREKVLIPISETPSLFLSEYKYILNSGSAQWNDLIGG